MNATTIAPAPNTYIRKAAGPYVVEVHNYGTHYRVSIYRAGMPLIQIHELTRTYTTWDETRDAANNAYRALSRGCVVTYDANDHAIIVAPEVRLNTPAKGTATKLTDAGMRAIDANLAGGYIPRGGQHGQASTTLLQSLAKRGHVTLDVQLHGRRKVIAGATITRAGRIAHLRATGGDHRTYELFA